MTTTYTPHWTPSAVLPGIASGLIEYADAPYPGRFCRDFMDGPTQIRLSYVSPEWEHTLLTVGAVARVNEAALMFATDDARIRQLEAATGLTLRGA